MSISITDINRINDHLIESYVRVDLEDPLSVIQYFPLIFDEVKWNDNDLDNTNYLYEDVEMHYEEMINKMFDTSSKQLLIDLKREETHHYEWLQANS